MNNIKLEDQPPPVQYQVDGVTDHEDRMISTEDTGDLFEIKQIDTAECRQSAATGIHIKRAKGILQLEIEFSQPPEENTQLKFMILREDIDYRGYKTGPICMKHEKEAGIKREF